MKKENGFTLIELLAVIIILSMIIIISAPRILEVVNKTKNSAADSSLKLVKKSNKDPAFIKCFNRGFIYKRIWWLLCFWFWWSKYR